jgi:alanyl-tRNA synthetase
MAGARIGLSRETAKAGCPATERCGLVAFVTERLYFTDSHLFSFRAHVLEVASHEGHAAVVLDRTAFYPTGGGQPNDTGRLGDARVVDVAEPEEGRILHVVDGALDVGAEVEGLVDAARRLDHLQQHTGQHILSQAFVRLFGAETRAFRMGTDVSEIDVDFDGATEERVAAAEALANETVFRDAPVRVHFVDRDAASRLPLRRDSDRDGELRVVEIEGFDFSPCGGTHACRTGEVGLIAIRGVERAKRMLRVEFVCGARALADYRRANRTALEVARVFSTGREDGPDAVRRLVDEAKQLRRRVRDLAEIASEVEGRRLYAEGEECQGYRVVVRRLDGRSADELRLVAHKVLAEGPALVLLASDDGGTARLVFAKSDAPALGAVDCGALMRAACETLGGRGGGRPDMAQGGGPDASRIDAALANARESVVRSP